MFWRKNVKKSKHIYRKKKSKLSEGNANIQNNNNNNNNITQCRCDVKDAFIQPLL